LIDAVMPSDQKKIVESALCKAGVEEKGWRAVLRGAIEELGKKIAGKAAEEIGELIGPPLKELFGARTQAITKSWKELFQQEIASKSDGTVDV